MLSVGSNNIIHLTRGNSMSLTITPISSTTGDVIVLDEGDRVLFTVKTQSGQQFIQKILTRADYDPDGNLTCAIDASDTIGLAVGEYFYDCLLMRTDNSVSTFISSKLFIEKAAGFYTDLSGGGNDAG